MAAGITNWHPGVGDTDGSPVPDGMVVLDIADITAAPELDGRSPTRFRLCARFLAGAIIAASIRNRGLSPVRWRGHGDNG